MDSSRKLKEYRTNIVVAVAVALIVYGVAYIVDQFSSYLYQYQIVQVMWLLFRLLLAAIIIYIGIMLYKMRLVMPETKMSSMSLLMLLSISAPVFISVLVSSPLTSDCGLAYGGYGRFPHFGGQLISNDRFFGYYCRWKGSSSLRVAEEIDLQKMLLCARAKGYDAIYRPARVWHPSSQEYYNISRMYDYDFGRDRLRIWCYQGGSVASIDHEVPTFVIMPCQETSIDWLEMKLREFFPDLSDDEYLTFAEKLATSYDKVTVLGKLDLASVKISLGPLHSVTTIPLSEVYEKYSTWPPSQIIYETPIVTITKVTFLDIDKSVNFTVSANGRGFIGQIRVESNYFLEPEWIREIYTRIFLDMGLPVNEVHKFTIE